MANELKHGSVGTELTQAEWEGIGTHVVANQAIGDLIYADTTSQLLRLGVGSTNDVLRVTGGKPDWQATTFITSLGTIATGVWQGTDIGVAYGGTGVSTLAANSLLTGNGASAIVAEANLTFDGDDLTLADSKTVALGTGSDSQLYYDGTDSFWNLRDTGTGDLMIALAGSYPSPDPDGVHIWKGSAGSVVTDNTSALTLEDSQDVALSLLSPAANQGLIRFGDPGSNSAGIFGYDHSSTPKFRVAIEGSDRLYYSAGAFAFQESTIISTTSGDLDLNPSGDVDLNTNALTNVGNAGSDWSAGSLTVDHTSEVVVTVSTTAGGNDARLVLKTPASSTGGNQIFFQQGSGDGSANNMRYMLSYEGNSGYLRLQTGDSDTNGLNADVFRVDDGQLNIDANEDWLDDQFNDYVCEACGTHNIQTFTCCGNVVWQDDVKVISPYKDGVVNLAKWRADLIHIGVFKEYDDGFVGYNDQRMAALLAGGIYQTRDLVDENTARLDRLAKEVAELRS